MFSVQRVLLKVPPTTINLFKIKHSLLFVNTKVETYVCHQMRQGSIGNVSLS